MKKLIAIGLTCTLPLGLSAVDPNESASFLGTVNVLVMDESVPLVNDVLCARVAGARSGDAAECMSFNRAVLTAHIQKVSALRERGRWM